ncbi:MAG TPA: ArsR family transcriptional regulator [archaeon]|nr:ArsR family transcriptional regulator [archaeon]
MTIFISNNQNNKPNKSRKNQVNTVDDEFGELSIKESFSGVLYLGKDWESLISKHKLRYDIWMFLILYNELNVSQISKWVKQSKSTVSRVLISMESDRLLVSRRGVIKNGEREKIPPKYYRISENFRKEEEIEKTFMEIPSDPQELDDFLLAEIRNYRSAIYNLTRLVNYLSSSLNHLDDQLKLEHIEKAKEIYKEFLSGINEPEFNFVFLDKKRFKKFYDLRLEYVLNLKKLVMEQDLDAESVFVYFDSFLPLRSLLKLNKKEIK